MPIYLAAAVCNVNCLATASAAEISKILDGLLALHTTCTYMFGTCPQIVLYRGDEILASEPEMPIIHCLLSRIPSDLPIEHLVREAGDLFLLYPPDSIRPEAQQLHQR